MSRKLKTGSKFDTDFTPGKLAYMWVAVFDHTQTRHTRHVRPVVVKMDGALRLGHHSASRTGLCLGFASPSEGDMMLIAPGA